MKNSVEFEQGKEHAMIGKSIHFNPYRNLGTEASAKNSDWVDGWLSVSSGDNPK